jgi:hypothetical protein
MKRRPTLFAIFLHEEPDGTVIVSADYLGLGLHAFDLGVGLMAQMELMSRQAPHLLTVQPIMMSEYLH